MANITIDQFSSAALSQIAEFLGKNPEEITKQIYTSGANVSDDMASIGKEIENYKNAIDELTKKTEKTIKKYNEALGDVYELNQNILHTQDTSLSLANNKLEILKKQLDILKEQEKLENKLTQAKSRQRAESVEAAKEITNQARQTTEELEKQNKIKNGKNNTPEANKPNNPQQESKKTNKDSKIIKSRAATRIFSAPSNIVNFLGSDNKSTISQISNSIASFSSNFGMIGGAIGGLVQLIASIVEQYDKINAASSKYARSVGGGVDKMQQMKFDSIQVADNISKWSGNTYRFNEILEHIAELSEKTGRVMDHMSEIDIKSLEDLTRYGINSDIINQYDAFGLSVETIDKRITDIYKTSGKHGLNAKAVTNAVNRNLKMAQQYTFAGGQRALERMAEKSVALKYNMETVARFADKVSTLEGATQAGAGLSVLGGDFARMGNPLSLLYGGLQDSERLNDMMLNITKNMAQWDSKLGEMRISAYNRQRLKAAAEYMGVDSNELINQAMTQGKRNRIDRQINNNITDEDTREYIRNLAQLDEKGNAYIRFSGDEKPTYLKNLNVGDKERLKKESEMMSQKDKATIGDIYKETRTLTDKLNDYIQWFRNKFFDVILKIAGYTDEEKARMKGLDKGNASYYNKMSDDYYYGGMSNKGLEDIKKSFGISENSDDYKKIQNRKMSQDEFDSWLTKQIYKKQEDEGKTYNGNSWVKRDGEPIKKAHGGEIRGKGTSLSDSIPAMLSDGEFVVNAKATQKHLPTLQAWNNTDASIDNTIFKAGKNQVNSLKVNEPTITSNIQLPQTMHLEPVSINLNGTIKLDAGNGIIKNFNAKELLNNNMFISELIREIEKATNYALDKTKVHMKYPGS